MLRGRGGPEYGLRDKDYRMYGYRSRYVTTLRAAANGNGCPASWMSMAPSTFTTTGVRQTENVPKGLFLVRDWLAGLRGPILKGIKSPNGGRRPMHAIRTEPIRPPFED